MTDICAPLRSALLRNNFDVDTIVDVLGPAAHSALGRGEPVPARRIARGNGELGTLISLFLLGDPCSSDAVAAALEPLDIDSAVRAGLFERDGTLLRAALDLRPVDLGSGTRWIVADLDDSLTRRTLTEDHVLGVGHASHSLLQATPTAPVGSVLDLGTGCGVQAVHACGYAGSVTATDVSARALRLAAATAALNELDIELVDGSWFEPVAGRTFDQIVANPPFVVGPARIEHTYRDSGLDLDGASQLVISQIPALLAPGGTAALLASWVHLEDGDWRRRVSSWLPDHGIDAWIVQRDVADPALYVGTWLRDAGLDPRDPAAQERAEEWFTHFDAAGVEGIGFGFVYLRRIDGPTEILAEDLIHGFDDPLGVEALAYFERSAWLRTHDVLEAQFVVDETTALERVFQPGAEGWNEVATRVHRGSGPNWRHDIDDMAAALLAGMRSDGLQLYELVELLALAHTGAEASAEFIEQAAALTRALVRHGLIRPN
ncbi:methyltransferase [Antrihabitans sp. YC2-6]|nr:methyltransferase [Antrihabitans sp. YC2-6]